MESTALHELIQEAKSENKAVRLITEKERVFDNINYKFIIEPEDEISFREGNVLRGTRCLIDLNFVVAAMIIPNRHEQGNIMTWIKNPYKKM